MITFITSIKHPDTCNSYRTVELLLEKTLKSVCNQTNSGYRVIVVCNKRPNISFDSPFLDFVCVDFPDPSTHKGDRYMRTCKDKGTKYMIGLVHAKNYKPDYVMFFDADDFIHRNIAEYVNTNLVQNGWFIDKGYLYRNGGMLISKLRNFHSCCGTCNILNFKFIEPPKDFTISTTQDTIVERIDHQYLYMILGDHSHTESYYRKIGYPLKAFPFPAAIWVVETSENISGRRFSNFGFPHIINEKLNEEFNIGLSLSFRFRLRGMILEWPKEIIKQRHKIVKKLIALTRNVKA